MTTQEHEADGCPMGFNVPPDMANDRSYTCMKSRCCWWVEEAQKCAVLVMAESQRKAVKGK